jgi:hypothetical protein
MFDTPVINVAIVPVFCFAAMSLAASTVTEALASLVKLRTNTLVRGIQPMLNDATFSDLARKIYHHALVNPLGDGGMKSRARFWTYRGPSYVKPQNFAAAFVDVLQEGPGGIDALKAGIDKIQDAQIKQLLQGMLVRANDDIEKVRSQLANWFDTAMDRVSGTYKRQAQPICFLAALGMSAACPQWRFSDGRSPPLPPYSVHRSGSTCLASWCNCAGRGPSWRRPRPPRSGAPRRFT